MRTSDRMWTRFGPYWRKAFWSLVPHDSQLSLKTTGVSKPISLYIEQTWLHWIQADRMVLNSEFTMMKLMISNQSKWVNIMLKSPFSWLIQVKLRDVPMFNALPQLPTAPAPSRGASSDVPAAAARCPRYPRGWCPLGPLRRWRSWSHPSPPTSDSSRRGTPVLFFGNKSGWFCVQVKCGLWFGYV